jgi:hypothetical protein
MGGDIGGVVYGIGGARDREEGGEMRTIVKEIEVYDFSELGKDAQDKAIENLYDLNVDSDWWDSVYVDAEDVGLKITGFDIDRGSYVKGYFIYSAVDTAKRIIEDHGKDCETYKTATAYLAEREGIAQEPENDDEIEGALDDLDEEFRKSILEDYRIMLKKDYEYLTSRESIIETIEANEYEFTANGKLYH